MLASDAPAPALRRRGRRAAGLGAWALVGAAVLELTARRFISSPFPCLRASSDPEVMFELRQGVFDVDGYLERLPRVRHHIGPDGCQRVGDAPAILVLGSSHAFGLGLDQRAVFPERLREALRARGHDLRGTRNCSVPGQHFTQQVRVAERALATEAHPLVLVLVAEHHLRRGVDWSQMAPRSAILRRVTSASRVARLLYLLRLQGADEARGRRDEPVARLAASMDRLAAAARARGGAAVIAVLGRAAHPTFDLVAEARRRGVGVVQVQPPPRDAAWTLDGEHWNARGHQRVAAELAAPVDALLRAAPSR